ncbi:hypothetical protein Hanom_Chr10g00888521 [Helianthus anomalus]
MSACGRGGEKVKGEKCFWKTNKLQDPKVCACLRDADISGQKCFWPKNKQYLRDASLFLPTYHRHKFYSFTIFLTTFINHTISWMILVDLTRTES